MAFLTDLSVAPIVNGFSLIHVVNPSDITQNPAGSSYFTPLQTVFDLINPAGITGGTYNSTTGVVTLYTSSGGSFDISGFTTGYTDVSVTGFTYDNVNTFVITETDGSTFSATVKTLSGVTIIGNTVFTTTGITSSAATLVSGCTYVGVSYSGNVDLTLFNPTGLDGVNIHIKDEGGYAGSYRIRIYGGGGLIDGNSYVDMNINYMSLTLIARNSGWWLI